MLDNVHINDEIRQPSACGYASTFGEEEFLTAAKACTTRPSCDIGRENSSLNLSDARLSVLVIRVACLVESELKICCIRLDYNALISDVITLFYGLIGRECWDTDKMRG